MTDNSGIGAGSLNPFRYRGYFYDDETGWYYLKSRYYDPEVGRFINADGILSGLAISMLGYNLYSYCVNNPIKFNDQLGNMPRNNLSRSAFSGRRMKSISYELSHGLVVFSPNLTLKGTSEKKKVKLRKYRQSEIETEPIISLSVGGGIGFGKSYEVDFGGVPLGVELLASYTDLLELSDKGLRFKNRISAGGNISVGPINILDFGVGKGHYYSDCRCSCDWWNDPFGQRLECEAREDISGSSFTVGFSLGLYYIYGAEISVSLDLTQLLLAANNLFS